MAPDQNGSAGNQQDSFEDLPQPPKEEPSYWNLPRREQIALLVVCRITEPLAYSSVSPYIYYMIKDFGYEDPATISALVTLVTTSFSLGQALTGVFWGRFSDTSGRKPALLLGLLGTTLSVLIFGTAQNIYMAILGRLLAGMLNGNVGVMRTMVAEFIGDKKEYQTRAFAILPITMNVGTVVGPMIGGLLADPVHNYPKWFGGSEFLTKYPYILPNLFPIPFLVVALFSTALFIEETLETPSAWLPTRSDLGLKLGKIIKTSCLSRRHHDYSPVDENETNFREVDLSDYDSPLSSPMTGRSGAGRFSIASSRPSMDSLKSNDEDRSTLQPPVKPSIKDVLTRPIKITLAAYIILMLHAPTFNQLLPLFLSTPRMPGHHSNPFFFNGGLGMSTKEIGIIVSVLGLVGVIIQLTLYPWFAAVLGNARLHKLSLLVFPPMYFLVPYLSFIPENPKALAMCVVTPLAAIVIFGRTFAIPPMTILITNATSSRTILGTVHGFTHSVTSTSRCVGPFIIGNLYSLGVRIGMINLAWWIMVAIVVVENLVASQLEEWNCLDMNA
jgi:MFS family permease